MAIRVIKRGEIKCDDCGTLLANITASDEVFKVLEQEAKYVKIICTCKNKTHSPNTHDAKC